MRVMAAEQLAEFKQAFAASVVHRRLTARRAPKQLLCRLRCDKDLARGAPQDES
jgi:hypothetical protein